MRFPPSLNCGRLWIFVAAGIVAGFFPLPAFATPVFETIQGFVRSPGVPVGLAEGLDGNFYGVTAIGSDDPSTGSNGTAFRISPSGAYTSLVNFTRIHGSNPNGLTRGGDGNFYGTAAAGGRHNLGTVFRMTPGGALSTLHDFDGGNGSFPRAILTEDTDGNLYGTTIEGGPADAGVIFRITPAGAFTRLANFNGSNGSRPHGKLTKGADGFFYGTTGGGGANDRGTVFRITTGGVLSTLAHFNGANGSSPTGGLVRAGDGNFYGTTYWGGSNDNGIDERGSGTIFRMTPAGTLATLVSFSDGRYPNPDLIQGGDGKLYGTVSQGKTFAGGIFSVTMGGTLTYLEKFNFYAPGASQPREGMIQGNDGDFYGTTNSYLHLHGTRGAGAIYRMSPSGVVTVLKAYDEANQTGFEPTSELLAEGGHFYGTTSKGGIHQFGTLFRIDEAGNLEILVHFNGTNGKYPDGGLIKGADGGFYGTTTKGGNFDQGTAFRISTAGALTTLVNFGSAGVGGFQPSGALTIGPDGNFYGTTVFGGNGYGTVYRMTPAGEVSTLVRFVVVNFISTGAYPRGGVTLGKDGNFYGTTSAGGGGVLITGVEKRGGTAFRVTPEGKLTILALFSGPNGRHPHAGLIRGSDGNFYGTTSQGGSSDDGTVFRLTPQGKITTLVNFNFTLPSPLGGENPRGKLLQDKAGDFYGTTQWGGDHTSGTVFRMSPSGSLTILKHFNNEYPDSGLIKGNDGNLYGTTSEGGTTANGQKADGGQIYRLNFGPAGAPPAPEISVTIGGGEPLDDGEEVSLGTLESGGSVTKLFEISNLGDASLSGLAATISGADASSFSVLSNPSPSIPGPGGKTSVSVKFTPAGPGVKTAVLQVSSNDGDEGSFKLALTGVGNSPVSLTGWGSGPPTSYPNAALGDIVKVASGSVHTAALKADGTVIAWGYNRNGEINVPAGLSGVTDIAAGGQFTLALKGDGTVAAWGLSNRIGVPAGLSGVVQVTAGFGHSVVKKSDGTVAAWGDNDFGQASVPAGLSGVVAVVAGQYHTVALKEDGTVAAWGQNTSGQCAIPNGLAGVSAISAGLNHTLALKNDGTVVAWGGNTSGQSTVPATVIGVKAISAGENISLAVRNNGTLVAWGNIYDGQAPPSGLPPVDAVYSSGGSVFVLTGDNRLIGWGSSSYGKSQVPAGLAGVTAVAAGGSHTVAMRDDGTVIAWGDNFSGQCTVPAGLTKVIAVAAGNRHTVALKADGKVTAWGDNTYGQINVPAGLSGVTAVAAGSGHTLALKTDGTVVAWGGNASGQSIVPAGLNNVMAISAGGFDQYNPATNSYTDVGNSVALKTDHTVVAWGNLNSPFAGFPFPFPEFDVVAIAAGASHALALRRNGTVFGWGGLNAFGETSPPDSLTGVTAISAGYGHSLALKTDGTVVAWGWNLHGQSAVPLRLPGVSGISAKGNVSLALVPPAANTNEPRATYADWSLGAFGPIQSTNPSIGGPDAAPHKDGVKNILKYAFNMNPSGSDLRVVEPGSGMAGLPSFKYIEGGAQTILRLEYVRLKSSDLVYSPMMSVSLEAGSFHPVSENETVSSINSEWERVLIEIPCDTAMAPSAFLTVGVSRR